tara:strand:- start:6632 stop:7726 length:1095 start_codon:yes stop_codon:yes gene_type:complete
MKGYDVFATMEQRKDCRMCHGDVKQVFALNPSPIANDFQKEPNSGSYYPLDLMECVDCGHVQLKHALKGLFKDYKYRTPAASIPHLEETAKVLRNRYPQADTVIEIGSNNGINLEVLLKYFQTVEGVDPACDRAAWKHYFNARTAIDIYKHLGPIDLIIANNVFAHIDSLDEVFEGIDFILDPHGAVIIEVQDFQASIDRGIFDTIYHEHLDQHRPGPWKVFLNRYNLELSAVERLSTHGGSLRITATRYHKTCWVDPPINWKHYSAKVGLAKLNLIQQLKGDVVAWGASAKLTTLIHHCDLEDRIQYCVDSTPEKQGLYIPGTPIDIVPDFVTKPDTVILGAWNYQDIFKEKHPDLNGVVPYA